MVYVSSGVRTGYVSHRYCALLTTELLTRPCCRVSNAGPLQEGIGPPTHGQSAVGG